MKQILSGCTLWIYIQSGDVHCQYIWTVAISQSLYISMDRQHGSKSVVYKMEMDTTVSDHTFFEVLDCSGNDIASEPIFEIIIGPSFEEMFCIEGDTQIVKVLIVCGEIVIRGSLEGSCIRIDIYIEEIITGNIIVIREGGVVGGTWS